MKTWKFWLIIAGTALYSNSQVVNIQNGVSGSNIQFLSNGNVSTNGKCFGNVSSLPSGGIASFNGKTIFKQGNLFFSGPINWDNGASTYPGNAVIRSSGSPVASITNSGTFYLKGVCQNTAGCTNTYYNPTLWNEYYDTLVHNNCYNYANDKITMTYAIPGLASGYDSVPLDPTVSDVLAGALSDGLTLVGSSFPGNTYNCGTGHLVYFAIGDSCNFGEDDYVVDFHWWRLDQKNGSWSMKPGSGDATDLDWSGDTITNPITSDRGCYDIPGYFMCTCGGMANIR